MMFEAGKGMPCINCARLACAVCAGAAGAGAGVSARLHPTAITITATSNPDSFFIRDLLRRRWQSAGRATLLAPRKLNCADWPRVYNSCFYKVKITNGLRALAARCAIDNAARGHYARPRIKAVAGYVCPTDN